MPRLRRPYALVFISALGSLFAASAAHSQSSQTQDQSQASSSEPQAQNAPAPADARKQTPAPDAKLKKPKKVWTEDEMGELKGKVSVVGDANSRATQPATLNTNNRRDHDVTWFRDQLAPLHQQRDRIDAQIRDLEGAKLGGRENIARPLERLQTQRADVQAKIDALEEQARKAGIEPGQLR